MRRTTFSMLALALTLGACDAPDETRQAARTIAHDVESEDGAPPEPRVISTDDGCALLTERQVEQALGFDVVMNDSRSGNCLATPADGSASAPAVDFKIENRLAAYDYFAAQPDAQPIAGLGDRAVWSTINDMTGNVVVVVGNRAIVVAVARADGLDARARQQAESLARALVGSVRP